MKWTVLTQNEYITSNWSGGTTTQLAIAPRASDYAKRDFIWRISSAKVELEHSDFTPLPDYDRFLAVLDGDLTLKVGDDERAPLPRLTVRQFDGGVPTQSWGRCIDFNLMLRKGRCVGEVRSVTVREGGDMTLRSESNDEYPNLTLALFCVSGTLTLPSENITAAQGELMLCREADMCPIKITAQTDTEFIFISIHSN